MLFLAILIMIGFTIAVCYMVPKINELRLELQKKDISISYLEQNKSTIKEEVDYLIKRKIKLTSDIEDYEDKILSIENGFREDIGEDHFTVSDHNVHINMIKTSLKSRVKSDLAVDLESVWSLNESTNQSIKKLIVNVFNTACDNVLLRNKGNQLDDIKSIIENERKNVERISPDGFKFFDNYVSDKIEEILLIVQRERKKKNREFDDVVEKGREHIKELEDDVSEKKRSLNRLKKSYKGLSDDVKDEIDAEIRLLEEKLSELLKTLDEEKEVFKSKYAGHIYFVSNVSFPGQIKIGMTRRDEPMNRIQELSSSSGIPFTMSLHGMMSVDHVFEVETDFHNYFRDKIVNERKEWFKISVEEAQQALIEKGFDLRLKKEIEHIDYENAKERLSKINIKI